MPTLSMFYGILIKMNWADFGKHNQPHFHAYYGEFEAVFTLDGEIISGEFPKKQAALVRPGPFYMRTNSELIGS